MNRKAWKGSALAGVVASALLPMAPQASPVQVGDFSLIDHEGALQQLSRLGNNKAVVVISQANSCAENIDQLHRYKHLRTTWEKQGVKIVMLNSSKDDNVESIRRTAATYGIDFPIMWDETQLVAESLKVAKAGEVLVIEPNSKQVLYHGPLDRPPAPERDDGSSGGKAAPAPLADALAKLVSGNLEGAETVNVPVAKGCDLSFPVATAQAKNVPDYSRDVAPILKENCAVCHVQGGIAPFAMNSYDIVRGFSPMIREVLLTKRMPPAQVDPHVNHFENANYISNERDADPRSLGRRWFAARRR